MLEPGRVGAVVGGHYIYSNVFVRVAQTNKLAELPEFALLVAVYHVNRSAKQCAGFRLDLDDHDGVVILGEDINFPKFEPYVAAEDGKAVTL